MYKNSFSLENRKENDVLASVHFIKFENVIKNLIPIFGNQLWTVDLKSAMLICIHLRLVLCRERSPCVEVGSEYFA